MKSSDVMKLALAAMLTTVSVVVCWMASFFSNMSLSITAVAGIFSAIAIINTGYKYAWLVYCATSVLVWLFLPDKECAVFYTVLFGHYPMLKLLTERIGRRFFVWLVKFLEYGVLLMIVAVVFRFLAGVWIELIRGKLYLSVVFFFLMFVLYDVCIGRIIFIFLTKLSKKRGFH